MTNTIECDSCGAEVPEGNQFCGACGTEVSRAPRCPECGTDAEAGQRFCGGCGTSLEDAAGWGERAGAGLQAGGAVGNGGTRVSVGDHRPKPVATTSRSSPRPSQHAEELMAHRNGRRGGNGRRPEVAGRDQEVKNPVVALILSLLIVGLGQHYNGEVKKGAQMFVGAVIGSFVTFGIVWVVVAIWSAVDAYTVAKENSPQ